MANRQLTTIHHSAPANTGLGFLAMYPFSGPTTLPEFEVGSPSTSGHLLRRKLSNTWEMRCLRKQRRRSGDEGCSAKRRRLMVEAEVDISENSSEVHHTWPPTNRCPPLLPQEVSSSAPSPCVPHQKLELHHPSVVLSQPEMEGSCMEIEAAQRKLQEIEDRITLEDDDEDEDLDVDPAPRRPVLVLSDSLKEGLQRGISDILPHTVAQSVSHSCMELVLWRPPDDPFCRKLKGSLQKQRKQQTALHQPPTPCPSPTPDSSVSPPTLVADTHSPLYGFAVSHGSAEEEMEM
ncbi:coiled-coil domain-containing protein 117 isoform X2 [Thalassophryne amazonica]|uniref:coiled-coil domain-containing protein 117 isoform X2 n=1 Tax=Thalassophryne amazonica TaxID=390379 RepID=UPI0014725BAD|nr:coiled-coil domain-containing protein 117 isoform X2 [Thalassophryne amazonica]